MLLDVSTSKDNLLDGSLRRQRQQEGPVFVTEQSLFGFAAMTAVVQLIWKTFQKEGGGGSFGRKPSTGDHRSRFHANAS